MKKELIFLGSYFFATQIFAANFELEVKIEENQYTHSPYVVITSLSDEPVVINEIIANRGKCSRNVNYPLVRLPITLKGYTSEISLPFQCSTKSIREITVETDKGTATYNVRR